MSEHDDDAYSVATFEDVRHESGDDVGGNEALYEEAVSLQRLVVNRLLHDHTRGRANVSYVDSTMNWTPEKMFRIDPLYEWREGKPEEIVEALRQGRVRARVSAAMGVGKTTVLAPYIAEQLQCRVLLVSLNALCLQQVAVYTESNGIGKYRRNRSKTKVAHLGCMTYADFNGYMVGKARSGVYAEYDVIIFDEAFVGEADVFVAKRFFSAYAHPNTSLLLASATIRTDQTVAAMSSGSMGTFKQLDTTLSVAEAIDTGKLVSDYLVDRTAVFVADDASMEELAYHYEENGVDCRTLDRAGTYEDFQAVVDWLSGDSTTPRVVVMDVKYSIGFNIPLSYEVLWPYRRAHGMREGRFEEWLVPESEQMVAQMKARTGRGLAPGSGGLVMVAERSPAVELHPEEKLKAFVKLCAGGIKPMRSGFWQAEHALLPNLAQTTAAILLKVAMPLELSVRYLATDGLFAAKYVRSLNLFAQPDHFLMPSAHAEPCGREQWIRDTCSFGEKGSEVEGMVPFEAFGEARFLMQVLSAVSADELDMERWRPPRGFCFDDGFDSGDEKEVDRFGKNRKLRRVDTALYVEDSVNHRPAGWSFQPESQTVGDMRRGGRFVDTARFRDAVRAMEESLKDYQPPSALTGVVDVGDVTEIPLPNLGSVESPGGSTVCTITADVCHKMNQGRVLEPPELIEVVVAAKPCIDRFVGSRLFDAFAGPWESILRTLVDKPAVRSIVKQGEATTTYSLVNALRQRFDWELVGVLKNSNVTRTRFKKLFRRGPKVAHVMKAIEQGDFSAIAQTEAYFKRVVLLKSLLTRVLHVAETANVYLPTQITDSQRMQYVQGVVGYGSVGQTCYAPYKPVIAPPEVDPYYEVRLATRFDRYGKVIPDRSVVSRGGTFNVGELRKHRL